MLKFFSINDVFRLIFVFAILFAVRIVFIMMNEDIMVTELSHLVIGQKMNEGMLIYKSIVDFTAPLSALVYHLIHWAFGKSYVALQVFSICFVLIQTVIFNYWVNRLELLTEKSYYPSVLFVVVASCNMEFMTLTPMMMATTFLMIAIFKALEVIRLGDVSEVVYQSGVYLGIGVLFYSPLVFFVLPLFVSLLAYSNIKPKKYIVYIYGVLFPLLCVGVFFMWKRALSVYLIDIVYYAFALSKRVLMSFEGVGVSFFLLFVLSVIGFQKGLFSQQYISFQKRAITVCFFVIFGFLFLVGLAPSLDYSLFYVLVPIAAYYLSILFDVKFVTTKIEVGFLIVIIALAFGGFLHKAYKEPFQNAIVKQNDSELKGKVLMLDDDISIYANEGVIPTTGFVNWELSKRYFQESNEENTAKLKAFFDRDTPSFVIDPNDVLETVKTKPWFSLQYSKSGEGLYTLKE